MRIPCLRMEGLSEADLAQQAATTPNQIGRLASLGILSPHADGTFRPTDIQRVRLAEALDGSGISLEDIGRAIASGQLSFSFIDLMLSQPVPFTNKTYRQSCDELGWSFEFIERVHEALGFPPPQLDDLVREDDMAMLPMAQVVLGMGLSEANVLRSLRVYGENINRITEAEPQFYHSYIETPLLESGLPEREMLEMAGQMSPQLQSMLTSTIQWVYRRHQERAIIEHVIGHVEEAMEQAGISRRRTARPPAMVFLDLAGYTKLTEEQGDEAAAELAGGLVRLVQRESRRHGGRAVKWLGDGVMFHFPDPGKAVLSSLDMVEKAPQAELPAAHVGVNAGPVVFRDGDYFGRTVNIAARIAARAGPGEVLVSQD